MVFRVYFWILGAPNNRPGGPWWYKDFPTGTARASFSQGISPSLQDRRFWEGIDPPTHDTMNIYPPTTAYKPCP